MNYNNYVSSKEVMINDEFFSLPDMGDYLDNDLFEEFVNKLDDKNENPMYYIEPPFTTKHGYIPEYNVLVFKAKLDVSKESEKYNLFDGDTLYFPIDSISTDDAPFSIDNTAYANVRDYLVKKKAETKSLNSDLGLRILGINCPEVPHYMDIPYDKDKDEAIDIPYSVLKEAMDTNSRISIEADSDTISAGRPVTIKNFSNHNISNFSFVKNRGFDENTEGETVDSLRKRKNKEADPNEVIRFIIKEANNDKGEKEKFFFEVIEEGRQDKYNTTGEKIYMVKVVSKDDSDLNPEYALQGKLAQKRVQELISQAEDVVIIADRTTLNRKSSDIPEEYRRIEYNPLQAAFNPFYCIYQAYLQVFGEKPAYRYLGYAPFGMDIYGRLLSAVYVKIKDKDSGNTVWINLAKRIAMEAPLTVMLPDYTGNPAYVDKYGMSSDAFKLWSYDATKQIYVDALSNIASEDRDDRKKIQSEVLGIDLDQITEHTMLIGDTLLMVPPTSIRTISQTKSERVSLLRSKGSATKTLPKSERLIEMQLYFNGDTGINGIPYEQKTPSGDTMLYHMNGLRTLIAQFRYTPFLPIHNHYLNNVLNIEAVTLASYVVSTVPDYPRTIQVTVTLQEFNYRHYMPEIPIPSDLLGQDIFTNMFAATINFPVMRYYYQKSLIEGERIKDFNVDDPAYIAATFGSKTALQPMKFAIPKIDFYIANEEQLKQKKQLKDKIKREPLGIQFKMNEAKRLWMNEMGKTFISVSNSIKGSDSLWKEISTVKEGHHIYCKTGIFSTDLNGYEIIDNNNAELKSYPYHAVNADGEVSMSKKDVIDRVLKVKNNFGINLKNSFIDAITIYEKIEEENGSSSICFNVKIRLNMSMLQDPNNLNDVRVYFAKQLQVKEGDILNDNCLVIKYSAPIEKDTNKNYYRIVNNFEQTSSIDFKFLTMVAAMAGVNTYDATDEGWSGLTPGQELDDMKDNLDLESASGTAFDLYPIESGSLTITNITCSYNNVLTNISLKALDSYAPQYAGGTDSIIDLTMMTQDEYTVGLMHQLPRICTQRLIDYRKVLTVSPLRINCELTKMMGLNEVVIESVDINTVPNYPGLFSINMRLVSVDRSMRNREALKRLNIQESGIRTSDVFRTSSVLDMNSSLGKAELYPDLELPTIDELERLGFNFIKYKYDRDRTFPDADFYFVYGHVFSSQMLRKSLVEFFSNKDYTERAFAISGDLDTNEDTLNMKFDGTNLKGRNMFSAESTDLQKKQANLEKMYKEDVMRICKTQNVYYNEKEDMYDLPSLKSKTRNSGWAVKSLKKNSEATKIMNRLDEFIDISTFNSFDINPDIKIPMKEITEIDFESDHTGDMELLKEYKSKMKNAIIEILKNPIKAEKKTKNETVSDGKPGEKYTVHTDFNDIKTVLVSENSTVITESCESIFKEISKDIINDDQYQPLFEILTQMMNLDFKEVDKETDPNTIFKSKLFPNMMFAAACALTGELAYRENSKAKEYGPTIMKAIPGTDGKTELVPFCLTEVSGQGLSEMTLACTEEERMNGVVFGPFGIKKYSNSLIEKFFNIGIQSGNAGFLDPYYNKDLCTQLLKHAALSDEDFDKRKKEYIDGTLNDLVYMQHAFFRIMLTWMYKLITEDLLPTLSMYYVGQLDKILKEADDIDDSFLDNFTDWVAKGSANIGSGLEGVLEHIDFLNIIDSEQDIEINNNDVDIINAKNRTLEVLKAKIKKIKDNAKEYKQNIYAGFICVPFLLTCTEMDSTIYTYICEGQVGELKQLVSEVKTSYGSGNFSVGEQNLKKFIEVLNKDYSNSELSENDELDDYAKFNRYKKIFLYAAEDPRMWILHSFYDMCKNDMRGRMARAFPTYYMLLIDEGREFGLWKIHDNFYNMSAISEFEVTKSRKIAADTAKVVLTNMYGTFTTEDEDIKDEYMYDFKEVWDSIFSPRKYFERIEQKRLNAREANRAKLVPGARIHLRMGYSGNAATLPTLFNGCVAEISTGELVTLVAQGDGVEISNPAMFNPSDSQNITDLKHSKDLPILKTIKQWTDQSTTPYKILVNPLTYRGTFIESKIREWTQNRLFNANPFGIVHFGDPEYKITHPECGEVAQNIYEAINKPSWTDDVKSDTLAAEYSTVEAPKIQIPIQNKSYWDLMHVCASVSPDFVTSVVPFGMRSSIFYGAPRYYYAYDYTYSETGDVIEKRKPFQQYHVYTSYTDIIQNNIAASELDVRTCAMGYYKGPGNGAQKLQAVGPLFLDLDIYPEKQKMMTVDCNFKYKPTDVPFTVPFVDNVLDEWSDNGGYQIAWRATAMGLKNSVKDMYKGELIVMGDPTVKPYDKIYIEDTYEGMKGACEAEAVVHRFATDTGFTTSIFVDCISAIDHKYELESSCAFSEVIAPTIATHSVMCMINRAFYEGSKPMFLAMRNKMKTGVELGEGLVKSVGKVVGKDNFLAGSNVTESILGKTADVMFDISPLDLKLYNEMSTFGKYAKSFKTVDKVGTTAQLKNLLKVLDGAVDNIDNLNPENISAVLKQIEAEGKITGTNLDELKKAMSKIAEVEGKYNAADLKKLLSIDKTHMEQYVKVVDKAVTNGTKLSDEAKEALEALRKMETVDATDAIRYKAAIKNMHILSENVENLEDVTDMTTDIIKNLNKVKNNFKYLDDVEDTLSSVNKMKKMSTSMKAILGKNIIMLAVRYALLKGVQEMMERKMKDMQVLTVFPLHKDGDVMVAGVDGHKGSIFGSPKYNTPGIFENVVIQFMENRSGFMGTTLTILRDMFIATDEMAEIAESYKRGQGFGKGASAPAGEEMSKLLLDNLAKDKVEVFSEYKARFLTARVKNITADSDDDDKKAARAARARYALIKIPDARRSPEIGKNLLPIQEIPLVDKLIKNQCFMFYTDTTVNSDKVFIGSDNFAKAGGNGSWKVQYKLDKANNVYDIPFLRPDAIIVFDRLVEDITSKIQIDKDNPSCDFANMKQSPIILHNATRINDEKGWFCTGYCFTLQVKNYNEFGNILEELNKEQDEIVKDSIVAKSRLFQYKKDDAMGDNTYNIFVACPL